MRPSTILKSYLTPLSLNQRKKKRSKKGFSPPSPCSSQMSIIYETSPKHCAEKHDGPLLHLKKLNKKLLISFATFLFSLFLLSFFIWFIFHPSKPQFYVRDAALYHLSLSSPPLPRLLNSTIQATIFSKNPNTRVGIYYDRLRSYAVYNGQRITDEAELPPFYQGHGDANFLSALLAGAAIPVAPAVGYEVGRDQIDGELMFRLRLDGQLRWKIGSLVSGRYRFDVDCVAVAAYGSGDDGWMPAPERGSEEGRRCSISA